MNSALFQIRVAVLTAAAAAMGAGGWAAATTPPSAPQDACKLLRSAGAEELLRSRELKSRSIEAPMPGPACELYVKEHYGRSVFLLIAGEKGSSAARDWFERERGKAATEPSPFREDRTFGLPAYSMVDTTAEHVELIVLKGDLLVVIQFDEAGTDLDKLRAFAKRILKKL
jgi:hypothetical protein